MLREREAQPEELATHLLHVEPSADEETVASLRPAAENAERLGAPSTAAAYLRRALAEPPRRESRGAVLIALGRAEARAGLAEATAHLRQAISQSTEPEARVHATVELVRALKFGGQAVQAVDVLEGLEPDLAAVRPELRELVEIEHIGLAYISEGARERLARRTAKLREPAGPPRTPLEAFVLAGLAFDAAAGGLRPAGEAAELASRALAGDLVPVDAMEGGYGMLMAGVATMWSDRLDDASRINARMIVEARRRGSLIVRTAAGSMQALVNWRLGRLADAESEAAMALELGAQAHGPEAPLTTAARAVKALVALRRAADDEELAAIESEVLEQGADPDALPYHLVLHARGLVRIARGELERGIDSLLECGRVNVAWGSGNPTTVPWRSDAALALARVGDRDEAVRLASEELELADSFGALRAAGLAQRALALVADDETTVPRLEAAVATLSASPAQLDLATRSRTSPPRSAAPDGGRRLETPRRALRSSPRAAGRRSSPRGRSTRPSRRAHVRAAWHSAASTRLLLASCASRSAPPQATRTERSPRTCS